MDSSTFALHLWNSDRVWVGAMASEIIIFKLTKVMGKHRHNQDKMFITAKEHVLDWGGKKSDAKGPSMVKLPFHYCNLGLTPTKDPYCTKDGIVFDLLSIVPYLRKHANKNPLTGEPLLQSDLVKLTFHKNEAGEFHCPMTFK